MGRKTFIIECSPQNMDIRFNPPKIARRYQAQIYLSRNAGGQEEYRVVIGREGTEVPKKVGEFLEHHEISDFLPIGQVREWVVARALVLKMRGKKVEFDQNTGYFCGAIVGSLPRQGETEVMSRIRLALEGRLN